MENANDTLRYSHDAHGFPQDQANMEMCVLTSSEGMLFVIDLGIKTTLALLQKEQMSESSLEA